MGNKSLGLEFLLDAYHCNAEAIMDLEVCYDFLNKALEIMKVHRLDHPYVFKAHDDDFSGKRKDLGVGITGYVPLIESSIVIHTFSPKNFVSIDFYTCGKLTSEMKDNLIEVVNYVFQPRDIQSQVIERGVHYYGS